MLPLLAQPELCSQISLTGSQMIEPNPNSSVYQFVNTYAPTIRVATRGAQVMQLVRWCEVCAVVISSATHSR
jgi:hypothetical protein